MCRTRHSFQGVAGTYGNRLGLCGTWTCAFPPLVKVERSLARSSYSTSTPLLRVAVHANCVNPGGIDHDHGDTERSRTITNHHHGQLDDSPRFCKF